MDAYCVLAWGLRVPGEAAPPGGGQGQDHSQLGFGDPMEQGLLRETACGRRWVVGLWECSGTGRGDHWDRSCGTGWRRQVGQGN